MLQIEKFTELMINTMGEFGQEIIGISNITGVDLWKIIFINFIQEIDSACTSIIAQDTNNNIIHARNLDFSIPYLENIIVTLRYHKNDETIFQSTAVLGILGVYTGYKPGAFSVSENERTSMKKYGTFGYLLAIQRVITGSHQISWKIREVLTHANSQNEAQNIFTKKINLITPGYIILSGLDKNQGVVLTMTHNDIHDVYSLSDEEWFVLITNYDRDDPKDDHNRRQIGMEHMNQVGRDNISSSTIFRQVLAIIPNFVGESTQELHTVQTSIFLNNKKERYDQIRKFDET